MLSNEFLFFTLKILININIYQDIKLYKAKILYSILSANVLQKHRTNKIFIVRFISMKFHTIFRATKSEISKTGQQAGKLFSRS